MIHVAALLLLSLSSEFRDTAVIPSFRRLDPAIAHFKTVFRARADEEHDALLVQGSSRPVSDSWWSKGDLLGFFLQDRDRPDRVYQLALRRQDLGGARIEVARYRAGELTLACRPEGSGALNLKFFFDPRSKTLRRQAQYPPFSVSYVVYEKGVPHFIAEDGKQFLALRPTPDYGFDLVRGQTAARILVGVPVLEWSTPQDHFRRVDRRRTEALRFGPQSRFSVRLVEDPSWGRIARGIEESARRRVRSYPLPQSTCAEFRTRRPGQYERNRCPHSVLEEIGPCQVFEDHFWFVKSFYDEEGIGGIGGFGYFGPIKRKYELFSPPEVADWSGSALLVEKESVWIGLTHRGEYGDRPGGLLQWDRTTHGVKRYDLGPSIFWILRYQGRLYLATAEGVAILRDGAFQEFILDQALSGTYQVVPR